MAKDCLAQGSTMQKMLTKKEKADWLNFSRKLEKYKGQGNQPVYFPVCKSCRSKMAKGTDIQHMDGNPVNKIKGWSQHQQERTAMQVEATKKKAAAKAAAKVAALAAGPVIVQPDERAIHSLSACSASAYLRSGASLQPKPAAL